MSRPAQPSGVKNRAPRPVREFFRHPGALPPAGRGPGTAPEQLTGTPTVGVPDLAILTGPARSRRAWGPGNGGLRPEKPVPGLVFEFFQHPRALLSAGEGVWSGLERPAGALTVGPRLGAILPGFARFWGASGPGKQGFGLEKRAPARFPEFSHAPARFLATKQARRVGFGRSGRVFTVAHWSAHFWLPGPVPASFWFPSRLTEIKISREWSKCAWSDFFLWKIRSVSYSPPIFVKFGAVDGV